MTTSPFGSPTIGSPSVRSTDRTDLSRPDDTLSADGRLARSMGATAGSTDGVAASRCGLDHEHRAGLVAIAREADGEERIVGRPCAITDAAIDSGSGVPVAA